jgi:hypothetical protein
MAQDLFQGSQLSPNVETTQKQQTAPEFYTNYLQNIANLGQNAVTNSGVAGLSPLQQQAMGMAPQMAFAGAGTLGAAADLSKSAGTTGAYDIVGNYMNPFTSNVVDEMGRKQQQDIQRNVMPGLAAASAATGNFGSKRQATATGQTLTDMQSNLIGQQYGALNAGYNDAMKFAQGDLTRELQAGQQLGTIGTSQNTLGTQGLKSMTDLGGIERTVAQEALDRPMVNAANYAKLLQPYAGSIPMGTTEQTTKSGGYENSPLADILGITTLINAYNSGTNQNTALNDAQTYNNIATSAKNLNLSLDASGNYVNAAGNKFKWNGTGFVPSPAEGGSINNYVPKYANGGGIGDISGEQYNDAAGGSTNSFYNGGYVYDQYGNLIG